MRFAFALILAALTGFIALSHELCWARVVSFVSASRAWAFGAMLGSYLLGLAIGSLLSMRFQKANKPDDPSHLQAVALFVLAANIVGFLIPPAISWLVPYVDYPTTFPLIVLAAALLGTTLPLICHCFIPPDRLAGSRISYIYVANIIGSGAGSLFTGFVLMDYLTMQQITTALCILGALIALILAVTAKGWSLKSILPPTLAAIAVLLLAPLLYQGLWDRLQWKDEWTQHKPFTTVKETRYGVITVDEHDAIYGGGAYDGMIEPFLKPNAWIIRPYSISLFHPNPKKVLVIGLSGGAWAQILAHHPQVEEVTVIEINRAYLDVIRDHPKVSSLLSNPKVTIHIDDGRRWLKRHPHEKYDAILMNTTHHWREFASALLSKEFLTIAKGHLKPGAVFLFNTTSSERSAKTAMEVFPNTMMVLNNVIASDSPLTPNPDHWKSILSTYKIDNQPVFDLTTEEGKAALENALTLATSINTKHPDSGYWLEDRDAMTTRAGSAKIITDDNLGHEYDF